MISDKTPRIWTLQVVGKSFCTSTKVTTTVRGAMSAVAPPPWKRCAPAPEQGASLDGLSTAGGKQEQGGVT